MLGILPMEAAYPGNFLIGEQLVKTVGIARGTTFGGQRIVPVVETVGQMVGILPFERPAAVAFESGLPHRTRIRQGVDDSAPGRTKDQRRSEEHTSELQSRPHLVCRLLLEKKKKKQKSVIQREIS